MRTVELERADGQQVALAFDSTRGEAVGVAVLTVAGTLIGVVAGTLITRRTADHAWIRDQRLQAFADTASGVASITQAAWLVARAPSDEHFKAFDVSISPSSEAATRLRLVGTPRTKNVLKDLWAAINELEERVAEFRLSFRSNPTNVPLVGTGHELLRCREQVVDVRRTLLTAGEAEFP